MYPIYRSTSYLKILIITLILILTLKISLIMHVVGAMSSKFPCKLYLWGYQRGGVMPSVEDQNCDGMTPEHPYITVPLALFDPHRNLEADRTQEYA